MIRMNKDLINQIKYNPNNSNNNNLNNLSIYMNNNNFSNDIKIQERSIIITFTFSLNNYGKKVFIETNQNDKFSDVINQLEKKYVWLQYLKLIKRYYSNGTQIINKDLTLFQLGISDDSNINIEV